MRNKVLDILRGHYLVAILVDHLYRFPSLFEFYNGRGMLWVSAAEGFVFISGYLLGVINSPKLDTHGFWHVAGKLLKRAIKLHMISVFFTVVYSLIGLNAGYYPTIGQSIKYTNFWEIVLNALFLRYAYGWADLLLLYVILVALSPVIIYAVHRGFWYLVIFVSFTFWAGNLYFTDLPMISGSVFPLLAWQFMFVLGIVASKYRYKLSEYYGKYFRANKKLPIYLLLVVVLASLTLSVQDFYYGMFSGPVKDWLVFLFDKYKLGPGRIVLFFVWFTFLYLATHLFYKQIVKYFGWLYLVFGENSLTTYIIQSIVLFSWFYFPQYLIPGDFWTNTAVTAVVILLVLLAVRIWILVLRVIPGGGLDLK